MAQLFNNDELRFIEVPSGSRRWFNNQPVASLTTDVIAQRWDWITPTDISATDWTIVKDASASVAVVADGDGGELIFSSNATTDDDGSSAQSIQECFSLRSGKRFWLEMKVKMSDATQSEFFGGLSVAFGTNPENVLASANRIGFAKIDGSTALVASVVATAGTQTIDLGYTVVANTYVTLGIEYDGVANVNFYVDRNYIARATSGLPTATQMAIALYQLSGDASGTKTMTCDYVEVIRER